MRVGAQQTDNAAHAAAPRAAAAQVKAAKLARLELIRSDVATGATLAHERTLALDPGLHDLLGDSGLQRGSTAAIHGVGATSFGLALVAQAVREGAFLAIVAPASFGLEACLDFDIPLRRVVQFQLGRGITDASPAAGEARRVGWPQMAAAIIEGFDVVLLADRELVTASQARQLVSRTRERGSVVVRVGGPSWAEPADLRFDLAEPVWQGLGTGHGHLRQRELQVRVAGRRWHGRPTTHRLALPAEGGGARVLLASQSSTKTGAQSHKSSFAGADIDAFLDAVDATPSGDAGRSHTA